MYTEVLKKVVSVRSQWFGSSTVTWTRWNLILVIFQEAALIFLRLFLCVTFCFKTAVWFLGYYFLFELHVQRFSWSLDYLDWNLKWVDLYLKCIYRHGKLVISVATVLPASHRQVGQPWCAFLFSSSFASWEAGRGLSAVSHVFTFLSGWHWIFKAQWLL